MEVILKQDFPSLGYTGDRVSVRRGYARNYLIPRGIALETGSKKARVLDHLVAGINAHKARLKSQAEELAQRLNTAKLEFALKFGAQGKSFGSVTLRDIELALEAQGFKLDRRQLRLPEPIKGGGQHSVVVKLHSEVSLTLPVTVTVERVQAKESAEDAEGDGTGRRRRKGRGAKAARTEEAEVQASQGEAPSE